MYKFSITPRVKEIPLRLDHYEVDAPISNKVGKLSFGRYAFGDELWTAPADGPGYKAGDLWLRVSSVDGVKVDGWLPGIHNGERVGSIVPFIPISSNLSPARTKIFFDLEFTGLHQKTSLVSLGMISESGVQFYAEATDYDRFQINPWLERHVISNLFLDRTETPSITESIWTISGTRPQISILLRDWLSQFGEVELWGDVLPYDWVLFCELFEADDLAERLPRNVYYIPFDLATLMRVKGVDPDIDRMEFSGASMFPKHNALFDAHIIKACYERLAAL